MHLCTTSLSEELIATKAELEKEKMQHKNTWASLEDAEEQLMHIQEMEQREEDKALASLPSSKPKGGRSKMRVQGPSKRRKTTSLYKDTDSGSNSD